MQLQLMFDLTDADLRVATLIGSRNLHDIAKTLGVRQTQSKLMSGVVLERSGSDLSRSLAPRSLYLLISALN
ncbi:hypothetical protein LP421_02120 (plasmid) [Rhizobium sp. RCAM05350]|nr:hypothetical protein LP421_02120 [Rhizobium sp. RCAM05350]